MGYYRGDPKTPGRLKFGLPPPVEVDKLAYQTLNLMAELNRTTKMWDVNALSLFPSTAQMDALLLHFCVAVPSDDDKQGPEPGEVSAEVLALQNSSKSAFGMPGPGDTVTDTAWHHNPKYLLAVAEKKKKGVQDYLASNVKATLPLVPPLPQDRWWERTGDVFVYSGQKLQYTELQKEMIRERAAKDKDNHYTYSQTYLSGSLCPVNEADIAQQELALSKTAMMSDKGFVYPAPQGGRLQFDATACANRLFNKPGRSVHNGIDNRQWQTDNKVKMMKDWRNKVVVDDAAVHPHMGNQQVARVH